MLVSLNVVLVRRAARFADATESVPTPGADISAPLRYPACPLASRVTR